MPESERYNFDLEDLNGNTWENDYINLKQKVKGNETYARFVVVFCYKLLKENAQYTTTKEINKFVKKTPDYVNKLCDTFINLNLIGKSKIEKRNRYFINHAFKESMEELFDDAVRTLRTSGVLNKDANK